MAKANVWKAVVLVDDNGNPTTIPGTTPVTNPSYETIKVGDVSGGNYFEVESDGNTVLNGDATSWDDLRFPLIAARLDTSAGRVDFNFADCTVDIQDNANLTDEICIIAQNQHSKLLGSELEFHIHWLQNQDKVPNFLIGYRWTNIGEAAIAVGSEQYLTPHSNAMPYVSGTIHQLTEFGGVKKPVKDTLSSILQLRLFRDTANDSSLFSGNDDYTGDVQVFELDLHYKKDGFGSNLEYVK